MSDSSPILLINDNLAERTPLPAQFALDRAPDAVFWLTSEARFVYVNAAACRQLGYSRDELLRMTVHDIAPDMPPSAWPERWQRLKQSRVGTIESRHRRKDGRVFPVEITANYLEFDGREYNCAYARDISSHKQAEAALLESETRYRTLAEQSLQGISIVQRGRRLYANPALARMLGYDRPQELIGRHVMERVAPHERLRLEAYARALLNGDSVPIYYQYQGVKRDGSLVWLEAACSTISWNGKPALLATVYDITERKRLEQEILEVSSREQQRLGQELHDGLGQSLTGITYLIRELHKKLEDGSRPEAAEAGRIRDLLAELRDQTHRTARGFYPVELETHGLVVVLRTLAVHMESIYGVTCLVRTTTPLRLPEHDVSLQLYRIAQEAVVNAVRHGKAQRVVVELHQEPTVLRLSVEDDGKGLPDTLEPGHGMGLRIMRCRAGIIGAALDLQRRAAGGSRVVCRLPWQSEGAKYGDASVE